MRPTVSLRRPALPVLLGRTNGERISVAHEWDAEKQWLLRELLDPALLGQLSVGQPELGEALGLAIEEPGDTELLNEAAELADGCRPFSEVHKVCFDPSLREKAKCFPRIRAIAHAKDLNFHALM